MAFVASCGSGIGGPPIYDRGGEWSFKKNGCREILAVFHGSRSLVFLAVMWVSQCPFFHETVSESARFFARVRKSQSKSRLFVCFYEL